MSLSVYYCNDSAISFPIFIIEREGERVRDTIGAMVGEEGLTSLWLNLIKISLNSISTICLMLDEVSENLTL